VQGLTPYRCINTTPVPTGDGVAASVMISEAGVVYGTGAINIARTDLTGGGFANSWGQGWNWTNPSGYSDGRGNW
jgi:hypothetical protein